MKKKLLFFDIDGTLLCGGLPGYIPDSAVDALKQAQINGHYVFINTGRTWAYLPQAVKEYPFDGYICGCGTYVLFHDKVLYRHTLPKDITEPLPALLRKCNVQGIFEGTECLYVDADSEPYPAIKMISDSYTVYSGDTVHSVKEEGARFEKFCIIGNREGDPDLLEKETAPYFSAFNPVPLGDDYYFKEFVPAVCSKATGIDIITEALGSSLDDCYVFGDGPNDISMMKHAGYSIAMGNSSPETLSAATYVTTPVSRDGIRIGMLHYGLI